MQKRFLLVAIAFLMAIPFSLEVHAQDPDIPQIAGCPQGMTKVAFISGNDVFVMNRDGSDLRNYTNGELLNPSLVLWSPDGSQLLIRSHRASTGDLFIVNSNGDDLENITGTSTVEESFPMWLPDSSQIIFVTEQKFHSMNADGSSLASLDVWWTNPYNSGESPTLSPDGSQILYTERHDIYVVNSDGTNPRNLTQSENDREETPVWSPDGTQIAFVSAPYLYPSINTSVDRDMLDIFVMNTDGSGRRNLTAQEGEDFAPGWSPDGIHIAFVSTREDRTEHIYVMNMDGSNVRRIGDYGELLPDTRIIWSPDSTQVAYHPFPIESSGTLQVYVSNIDDNQEHAFNPFGEITKQLTWQPCLSDEVAITDDAIGSEQEAGVDSAEVSTEGQGLVPIPGRWTWTDCEDRTFEVTISVGENEMTMTGGEQRTAFVNTFTRSDIGSYQWITADGNDVSELEMFQRFQSVSEERLESILSDTESECLVVLTRLRDTSLPETMQVSCPNTILYSTSDNGRHITGGTVEIPGNLAEYYESGDFEWCTVFNGLPDRVAPPFPAPGKQIYIINNATDLADFPLFGSPTTRVIFNDRVIEGNFTSAGNNRYTRTIEDIVFVVEPDESTMLLYSEGDRDQAITLFTNENGGFGITIGVAQSDPVQPESTQPELVQPESTQLASIEAEVEDNTFHTETFTDNALGWEIETSNIVTSEIRNDGYYIRMEPSNYEYWLVIPGFTDWSAAPMVNHPFEMEITVSETDSQSDDVFGFVLVFDAQENYANFKRIYISQDGTWQLWQWDGNTATQLSNGFLLEQVNLLDARSIILRVVDDSYEVHVDEKLLAEIPSIDKMTGTIGLGLYRGDNTDIIISAMFDGVILRNLADE